jgi:Zn-dependent protease
MFNLITQNPLVFVAYFAAILIVLSLHEFSHALVAYLSGDQTAKNEGRLTLNPLAHVDFLGLIALFFIGFGWGKPVPIDPYNFKKPKMGVLLVSLAGPLANFFSAIFFIIVLKILVSYFGLTSANLLTDFLMILIVISFSLFIFNLIPIPPLDGSKVLFTLLPDRFMNLKYLMSQYGTWVLLGLILADNFLNLNLFSSLINGFLNIVTKLID